MDLFSYTTGSVSIRGSKTISKNQELAEQEVQTEEISYVSRGMATRPLVDKETQFNRKIRVKDSSSVEDFLKKVEPLMSKELEKTTKAFQYYQIDWKIDSAPQQVHFFPGPKVEEVKKSQLGDDYFSGGATETSLSVSALSWNLKGFNLAVGYSYTGHVGWCSHRSFLRIYALSGKTEEFEVEGCVSSLSFVENKTSIIVGTYNGIVINWDLESGNIVSRSSIDEYQHREAVTSIDWAKGSQYSLFTSSTDGKILNWNPENLDFPIRGLLVRVKNDLEGSTSLSVSEDNSSLIISSESGKVFKYNIPVLMTQPLPSDGFKIKPEAEVVLSNLNPTYRQQLLKTAGKYCLDIGQKEIDVKSVFFGKPDILKCYPSGMSLVFEKHDGPVSEVACNPFHRNLFATGSFDGSVKVFSALNSRALLVLEPVLASKVLSVAWSEARPLVLAAGYDNGSVFIYDFLQSKTQFILEISCSRNAACKVRFNKQIKDYLAIGYRNGDLKIYQMPGVFNMTHPDEGRRAALLLESVMSDS